MHNSLSGRWQVRLNDGSAWEMTLPGTLDESGVGYPDRGANQWHPDASLGDSGLFDADAPIATRLTRRCTYEGEARISRRVSAHPRPGRRLFVDVERARCLRLWVNGREVPDFVPPSLSTPRTFEVTGLLGGEAELTFLSDNSYPGLPHDAIVYSSAATDETQTNWNGLLGALRLREEAPVFIQSLRVYPVSGALDVAVEVSANRPWRASIALESDALAAAGALSGEGMSGRTTLWARGLKLREDARLWDEYDGALYTLRARLSGGDEKAVRFGLRRFGGDGEGHLALNGRRVFLRSEANCAEFPETGHPPMDVAAWRRILATYRDYGVNLVRFHSHCPPDAAFEAADELGMMMQPELSHWNPKDAFESDEAWEYYRRELRAVLLALANHPSFVMLTLGNELMAGALGHARMDALLDMARAIDGTRLYANGSNVHYGQLGCDARSDFYTGMGWHEHMLRGVSAGEPRTNGALQGHINGCYPDARTNYEPTMARLRQQFAGPVFGFEVGQFEVLPDFDELEDFRGVTDPANLRLVRDRVRAAGLEPEWKRRVAATGELSRLCYREEVEAALRTPSMSGLSLLGLQDFPGQGTALVGMLNSHLTPKPYDFARPERFRAFFRQRLPLALLPKYTYENTETLEAEIAVANYGRGALSGALQWTLSGGGVRLSGELTPREYPEGALTSAGAVAIPLNAAQRAVKLTLTLQLPGAENAYDLWVYPPVRPKCPEGVLEARAVTDEVRAALAGGGAVLLAPPATAEALPGSVAAHFSTDFWSVGTFPTQSGCMGQLINDAHPLFHTFPTEFYTNWQWWPMASARAVVLPRPMKAIVAELDSYAKLRPMAQLFECRAGGGRVLFSSMGLREIQQYPEARALLDAIYRYMTTDAFAHEQTLTLEELSALTAQE